MDRASSQSPLILGFNGSHDGSVALLRGGQIIGTISRERVTRKKKASNGNQESLIQALLDCHSVSLQEIEYIAFCDNYLNPDEAFLKCRDLDGSVRPKSNIYGSLEPHFETTESFQKLTTEICGREIPSYFVNHHLGHIAYSFFTSSFEQAICFSLDGSPGGCSMLAQGKGNKILPQATNEIDISLAYDWFTYFTLGNPLYKAGSMMGLAAHGRPSPAIDRQTLFDLGYAKAWSQLTGKAAQKVTKPRNQFDETDIAAAATIQHLFEEIIIGYLAEISPADLEEHNRSLCLSGGSFLNCKLNGTLKERTAFQNIHIPPACGDDGLAVGAALFVAHSILDLPRVSHDTQDLAYSGPQYPIEEPIGQDYDEDLIATLLEQGKVVGFFQGRSEFGPRALGNRSLLADPRSPHIKDYLNDSVKKREWFRPFGASVLVEEAPHWFALDCAESPYMLKAYPVLKPKEIPAVVHADNTSRIQTVSAKDNPRYYSLIQKFFQKTSIPMLLNTSLNDRDEPMVETPEDAIRFFNRTPIDALVLQDRMLIKGDRP